LHTGKGASGPTNHGPIDALALVDWAMEAASKKQPEQLLLALGCLRVARHFDAADQIVQSHGPDIPTQWRAAWDNEQAALAWHRGRAEDALDQWQSQAVSVPVLFNRGMAALFLDKPKEAQSSLSKGVNKLPDDSAWHHLGRLYLALAQMRG